MPKRAKSHRTWLGEAVERGQRVVISMRDSFPIAHPFTNERTDPLLHKTANLVGQIDGGIGGCFVCSLIIGSGFHCLDVGCNRAAVV